MEIIGQNVDLNGVMRLCSMVGGIAAMADFVDMPKKKADENKSLMISKMCQIMDEKKEGQAEKTLALVKSFSGLMMDEDLTAIKDVGTQLGKFDFDKVEKVMHTLRRYGTGLTINAVKESQQIMHDNVKSTADALFDLFDQDKSGALNYYEFKDLCKYMKVNYSEDDSKKVFVLVDGGVDGTINRKEFTKCILILKTQTAKQTLNNMGFTDERIFDTIMYLALTLLLLFLFIFMGIASFAE